MAGDKIPKIPNTTYQAEGREEKRNLYFPSFLKTLKTPNTYLSGNRNVRQCSYYETISSNHTKNMPTSWYKWGCW